MDICVLDALLCGVSVWACTTYTMGDRGNSPGGRGNKHSQSLLVEIRLLNPIEAALADEPAICPA